MQYLKQYLLFPTFLICLLSVAFFAEAQLITVDGKPARLDIRSAGASSIRITLKPLSYNEPFPQHPAIAERAYAAPFLSLTNLDKPVTRKSGNFIVQVTNQPLAVAVHSSRLACSSSSEKVGSKTTWPRTSKSRSPKFLSWQRVS